MDIIEKMQADAELVVDVFAGKNNLDEETFENLLKRDSVAEAQKMINDLDVPQEFHDLMMLGHAFRINKAKDNALKSRGDSTYAMRLPEYLEIVNDLGFEKVLELDFFASQDKRPEKLYFFWRNGVLLKFDTYYGGVNSANIYFNWKPNRKEDGSMVFYPQYLSGGFDIKDRTGEVSYKELYPDPDYQKTTDPEVLERKRLWDEKFHRESIYVGYFDAREAIRYNLGMMDANGTFLPTWDFQPFVWFLHFEDAKVPGYDYKQINKERAALLPEHVRKAILVEG